jgi:Flp pilus assembly pilin Flp
MVIRLRRFVRDETGQDLIEYALLAGIIGISGVLLFPLITDRMGAAYEAWITAAQNAWEPCPPGAAPCS